ncbi:hypothetical protein M1145_01945 [Patescibacteria group bacterium]|nr:hypothetical protein [Patescibacteria group bacterium]
MKRLSYKEEKKLFLNSLHDKRYLFYYYLSLSLGSTIIFLIFIVYPVSMSILKENNAIQSINASNIQMQNKINNVNSAFSSFSYKVKNNLLVLSNVFPSHENTGFVFGNIYQILKNNNMQLNSISFVGASSPSITSTISSIPAKNFNVSMQITGTYANLLSMIATLDKYPQKILIYNVSFSGASSNTNGSLQNSSGTISMDAIVFYSN